MGLGPSPVPFFGQSDQPQRRWPQTTCPQPNKASADAVGRAQPHMLSMLIVPPPTGHCVGTTEAWDLLPLAFCSGRGVLCFSLQ